MKTMHRTQLLIKVAAAAIILRSKIIAFLPDSRIVHRLARPANEGQKESQAVRDPKAMWDIRARKAMLAHRAQRGREVRGVLRD